MLALDNRYFSDKLVNQGWKSAMSCAGLDKLSMVSNNYSGQQ